MRRYGCARVILGPVRCHSCALPVVWTGWAWYNVSGGRHRCWRES